MFAGKLIKVENMLMMMIRFMIVSFFIFSTQYIRGQKRIKETKSTSKVEELKFNNKAEGLKTMRLKTNSKKSISIEEAKKQRAARIKAIIDKNNKQQLNSKKKQVRDSV